MKVRERGILPDTMTSLTPWVVVSGLVGVRLFHVIDKWGYYAENPLQIIVVQQGGLAIWGGLAGGATAVIIYAKLKHMWLADWLPKVLAAKSVKIALKAI